MRRRAGRPKQTAKKADPEAVGRESIRLQAAMAVLPTLAGRASIPVAEEGSTARSDAMLQIVSDAWDLADAFVEVGAFRLSKGLGL